MQFGQPGGASGSGRRSMDHTHFGSPSMPINGSPASSIGSTGETSSPTRMRRDSTTSARLASSDSIKVAVRVRPLLDREADAGASTVVHVGDDASTVRVIVPGPVGSVMQREFQFHAALGPNTDQADVITLCGVHQLIDAAMLGYNVTIFAYGQTGSGKTYTMSGKEEVISDENYSGDKHDGIVTRAVLYLFDAIEKKKDARYNVAGSYLEIYNENVYDLVNFKQKPLPVKWDATQGFYVPGLRVVPTTTKDSMYELVRTGMKHRHVGSHQLNMESSRSHSITTLYVHAMPTDPGADDYGTARLGKISFVDLAGSERLRDTKSEGAMLKETTNINKSLFVLGKVISTLSDSDASGMSVHVPYRDSKLTKLLMDSLGGSALALMIACCSPNSGHVEETLSTLSYAMRTKNITNRPCVQYDPKEAQMALLRREMDLLRQENTYLRTQLGIAPAAPMPGTPGSAPPGGAAMALGGGGGPLPTARSGSILQGAVNTLNTLGMQGSRPPSEPSLGSSPGGGLLTPMAPGSILASGEGRKVASGDMQQRLKETQTLLSRFSEENARLAWENDRLQVHRQVMGAEHADVLNEIEMLRSKLAMLESAVKTGGDGGSSGRLSAAAPPGSGGSGRMGGVYGMPPVSSGRFGFDTPPPHALSPFPGSSQLASETASEAGDDSGYGSLSPSISVLRQAAAELDRAAKPPRSSYAAMYNNLRTSVGTGGARSPGGSGAVSPTAASRRSTVPELSPAGGAAAPGSNSAAPPTVRSPSTGGAPPRSVSPGALRKPTPPPRPPMGASNIAGHSTASLAAAKPPLPDLTPVPASAGNVVVADSAKMSLLLDSSK